jgi:hypothetical protein
MKMRVFKTTKENVYGDDEKLLFEREDPDFTPSIGEMVMIFEDSYRVVDICFESFDREDGSMAVMVIPE